MRRVFHVLFLVLLISVISAGPGVKAAAKTEEGHLTVRDLKSIDVNRLENFKPKGCFVIEVLRNGRWGEAARIGSDHISREYLLDLEGIDGDEKNVKIRITGIGGRTAHLDSVLLDSKPPLTVNNTKNIKLLNKLSKNDNDVIDAHNGKTVLSFSRNGMKNHRLLISGSIESTTVGHEPFVFPHQRIGVDQKINDYYTYRLNSMRKTPKVDGIISEFLSHKTFFREFSSTSTGHPDGYTSGWVCNDDKHLYAAIDFPPDNAIDGDLDYGKVYVKTDEGVKEFKVSIPEQKWGRSAFAYTNTAKHQHKTYEFKIPLKKLGKSEGNIQLAFSTYGTAASGNMNAKLAHNYLNNTYLLVYHRTDNLKTYGQLVKYDGTTLGSEFRISNSTDSEQICDVAFDPETGRYLVVWYVTSPAYAIRGQLVNADGSRYGDDFVICDNSANQFMPAVGYDKANKRFFVVWTDSRNSQNNVYGQIVNSDGTLEGTASDVNFPVATGLDSLSTVDIAYDSKNGRFLVCWYADAGVSNIYGQLMNADGSPYGTAVDTNFVICNATGLQLYPVAAYDSKNGRYVVVWQDNRNGDYDVYGQIVNADGSLYGTASNVNFLISNDSGHQLYPQVDYNQSSERFLTIFQESSSARLMGQYSGPDGSPLDTDTNVNFVVSALNPDMCALQYNVINENFLAAFNVVTTVTTVYQTTVGTYNNSAISVSPDSLSFGDVAAGGSSDPQQVTAASSGAGNLYAGDISITGTDASLFILQNDSVSKTLFSSGGKGTVEVVFSPTAGSSQGDKNATLVIPSTDPDTSNTQISLTGTVVSGTPPPAPELISPANGQTTNSNDVEFKWKEVIESTTKGPVSKYKLYVSTNEDFTNADVYEVTSDTSNKVKATGFSVVFLGVVLGAWRKRKDGAKYLIVLVLLGALFLGIGFTGCGGGSGSNTTTSTTETITYKVYNLNYGQTYYWKVEAVGGSGLATPSETWTFDTPAYGL